VRASDGLFVDVYGSCYGSQHDLTICNQSGVVDALCPITTFLGDKAYIGDVRIRTPVKGKRHTLTQQQINYNSHFSAARVLIENSIGRLKKFKILKDTYRANLSYHPYITKAIANMVNWNISQFAPLR